MKQTAKLTTLVSPDLFSPELKQLFDAKTGKWKATVNQAQTELNFKQEDEQEGEEGEQTDPNQLSLF